MKEDRPEGRALHQILLMLNLGMGEDEKKSRGLVDLLHRSRQALASNLRDYVYGFLGLTSSTYRAKISVGYEESVADTFRRVAKTIVKQGDGIELLYNIYTGWIPNLICRHGFQTGQFKEYRSFSLGRTSGSASTTADVPYVCAGEHVANIVLRPEEDVLICKRIYCRRDRDGNRC